MVKLTDLVAELEAAEAGSRDLDSAICKRVLGWVFEARYDPYESEKLEPMWYLGGKHMVSPPRFTFSVDKALTLVPEGWRVYALQQDSHLDATWWAGLDQFHGQGQVLSKRLKGPALALCAAALKARNAQKAAAPEGSGEEGGDAT